MLPLASLPYKGQLYFFKWQHIIFWVQFDSLCFSDFNNIAHSVYLNVILT
jgi:hypothetical protein